MNIGGPSRWARAGFWGAAGIAISAVLLATRVARHDMGDAEARKYADSRYRAAVETLGRTPQEPIPAPQVMLRNGDRIFIYSTPIQPPFSGNHVIVWLGKDGGTSTAVDHL